MIFQPLESIAKVIAGQSPASSTYNSVGEGLPFFQGKADFQEMYPKVRMWSTSTKRKEAEPGDILISVRAPVGAVNICNQKSIIGRGLSAIRPSSSLDSKFLYYYFKASERQIKALGTGSTFKAITQNTLKKISIPLPSLENQKRIAYLLGRVEGLIVQRKQHLQNLDDLLKSVFLKMFGDLVRNSKNHKISTLAPYITHLTSGGRGWAKYYASSGKRFIRSLDVQMNNIGSDDIVYVMPPNSKESERTRVQPGDVLLTITGSKIGRVCYVPQDFEEAYISQHVAIIRTKNINPIYLSFYFSMPNCGQRIIVQQQYGQAQPGLNLTQIKKFEIIDPGIDLQNVFVAIVEKVEDIKSYYYKSLTDLETLYNAISQKAFKGELDLSRVSLISEAIEVGEKERSRINKQQEIRGIFELPNPTDLTVLKSSEGLKVQINQWLAAWFEHPDNLPFSAQKFMETVQQRLWELEDGDRPESGASEYDQLKGWLFQALESGQLKQTYDNARNRVRVSVMEG